MRYFLFLSFICATSWTFSEVPLENFQKRIKDHLLIKDYTAAFSEIKIYLAQYPQSKELHSLMIRTFSESGQGVDGYKYFLYASEIYPELKNDHNLIEGFCWAILENAQTSSQYVVNISSMIGASLTHDAKAVKILQRYLNSTNAYLRMIAVQLAAQYGDTALIAQILALLKKETVWYVKLEIMRSLGRLHVVEAVDSFKEIITSRRSTLEERAVAAESLIAMYDHLDDKELDLLIQSPRAGLRYFSCQIISYLNLKNQIGKLGVLLEDTSSDIKIAALNTIAVVGIPQGDQQKIIPLVEKLLGDLHIEVAITASRVLSYYHPDKAFTFLEKTLESSDEEIRRLAASALVSTTKEGRSLALKIIKQTKDPFIKVNLAYGMLGYGEEIFFLSKQIADFLSSYHQKLMIDSSKNPLFKVIAPSLVSHTAGMAQYPEAVDQHTRLHLLNQLAILRYPDIELSIKKYLKTQTSGMTYAASRALIEEGAEDSISIIQQLLKDEDETIRVQAALVLAMLGGDKQAIDVLQKAYPKVDREIKMSILEALGHIGSKDSIPFLMNLLDDPFNVMRIIAASSIIQCIYH